MDSSTLAIGQGGLSVVAVPLKSGVDSIQRGPMAHAPSSSNCQWSEARREALGGASEWWTAADSRVVTTNSQLQFVSWPVQPPQDCRSPVSLRLRAPTACLSLYLPNLEQAKILLGVGREEIEPSLLCIVTSSSASNFTEGVVRLLKQGCNTCVVPHRTLLSRWRVDAHCDAACSPRVVSAEV